MPGGGRVEKSGILRFSQAATRGNERRAGTPAALADSKKSGILRFSRAVIRGLSTSRTSLGMTQTGRQRRNLELALKNRAVKGPAPSSSPWQGEEKDGGAGILRFALE